MQDPFKLGATAVVWFSVVIILSSAFWAPVAGGPEMSSGSIIALAFVMGIVGLLSTAAIWQAGQPQRESPLSKQEKAKRDQRTSRERLMQTLGALDDEEAAAMLEDFKSRLQGGDSDGEISAVEMLRQERRSRN